MSKLPKFKFLSLTYAYPFTGCFKKGETEFEISTLLLAHGSQQWSARASLDRLGGPVAPISSQRYILRLQVVCLNFVVVGVFILQELTTATYK